MKNLGQGLTMVFIVAVAGSAIWWIRSVPPSAQAKVDLDQPQCGHWCVQRCCELLGAPVELSAIMVRMPPHADGQSLLDLSRVLKDVGFQVDGRRETLASLAAGPFPVIAHLEEPDHFVVVTSVEDDSVHVFDGAGRRTRLPLGQFQLRFSGNVLFVQRDPDVTRLPAFRSASTNPAPGIQFKTLFIDCGEISTSSKEIVFSFPFRNLGTRPLVIESVEPSCSCLSVQKPEAPVLPGRGDTITFSYQPEKTSGPFSHHAFVGTNDSDLSSVEVKMAGWVDRPVEVSPPRLDFGEVAIGDSRSRLLTVHGLDVKSGFEIVEAECSLTEVHLQHSSLEDENPSSAIISFEDREFIGGPRKLRHVRISVAPKEDAAGLRTGEITIHTNVPGSETLTIPIRFHVVPPVKAFPSLLSFEKVATSQTLHQKVTLISRDDRLIRILRVEPMLTGWEWSFSNIKPDSQVSLLVTTSGTAAIANDGKHVRVFIQIEGTPTPLVLPLPVSVAR